MKTSVKSVIRKDLLTKDGKARIEFIVYFEGKQHRVPSGKSIEPKYWCSELGCVDKKSLDALEINKQLTEKIVNFYKFIKTKEVLNEKISLNDLKSILKGQTIENELIKQKKKHPTISEAFDSYIANHELKSGTKTNYIVTKNILYSFCNNVYHKEININAINFNFFEDFKTYLRIDRENGKNTVGKRFRILKAVYSYADNQGYIEENAFKGYKIEHGKPREVALSAGEYNSFRKVKFPKNICPTMKITQNIFVFCCETGLRYSDVMDLRWEHVSENMESLLKKQIKTERKVFVPLSNQAKAILVVYKNKYKDSNSYIFPRIDNQSINKYLKKIAKIAKIDKNLTSHVARHTFGTRLGASGTVQAFEICELMGHSDIGMTQRYINLSKDDLRKTMKRVWEQKKTISP